MKLLGPAETNLSGISGWDGEGCPMTLEEAEEKDIKDDVCPKCVTKGIKIKEPIAEKEVKKEVKKETLKPVETNGVEHDEDEGGVKLEYHPYTGRLITGQDPWFEAGW